MGKGKERSETGRRDGEPRREVAAMNDGRYSDRVQRRQIADAGGIYGATSNGSDAAFPQTPFPTVPRAMAPDTGPAADRPHEKRRIAMDAKAKAISRLSSLRTDKQDDAFRRAREVGPVSGAH